MTAARLRTMVRVDHEDWHVEIPNAAQLSRKAARKGWRDKGRDVDDIIRKAQNKKQKIRKTKQKKLLY